MNKLVSETNKALEDLKAQNITVINVQKMTSITDYLVICTSRSRKHGQSLSENVRQHIKQMGYKNPNIQGLETCEWIIVDMNSVVLHIMLPEIRDFYQLEKLWDKDLVISNVVK
ncbi:MAG: ribosome silencing factor [Legionellales bacterium]|nr:ribosome silencing factor [Legionellales bacterium]